MDKKIEVLNSLPTGSENAISSESLWDQLGLNARDGRRIIYLLRQDENPILSGPNGYYLASSGDKGLAECKSYFRQMFRRAMSSLTCARSIERFIRRNDNQISLFDLMGDTVSLCEIDESDEIV